MFSRPDALEKKHHSQSLNHKRP